MSVCEEANAVTSKPRTIMRPKSDLVLFALNTKGDAPGITLR